MFKPGLVSVAYPYGTITPDFHHSLLALLSYDLTMGNKRLAHGGWLISRPGGGNVATCRNEIVRAFLNETEAEWLWFIDTDQAVDYTALDQLVESAEKSGYRIVSALIMAEREKGQSLSPACVVLDDQTPPRTVRPKTIPAVRHWECLPGAGCVLIHREVLEAMLDKYGNTPWPWFAWSDWHRKDSKTGQIIPDVMGEDYTFMLRATSLGFVPVVDTDIEAGHVKPLTLTSAHFWPQVPPDMIGERTYVIIPVKDTTPQQSAMTQSLLKQLERQGGYYEILVIDNGSGKDTRRFLKRQTVATVIDMPGAGIHHMWNAGVNYAAHWPKSNLCFLNNDLRIGDDFLSSLSADLRSADGLLAISPNYDGRELDGIEPQKQICAGHYFDPALGHCGHPSCHDNPDAHVGGGVPGFAFMVRSELFATGYRFPEDAMWWFGDNDLLLYITEVAGGAWALTPSTTVEHLDGGGKTGDWTNYLETDQGKADLKAFTTRWS